MDLIQTRSYQDDLLSEIFPSKNQEMFQDWFVTERFHNIIGNKGIDGRSTLSNSSKEEWNIILSSRFNEPVKKQEMYRISRIDSLFSKWDLLQTYMPWFFTSTGCKYLENMLLDNLQEILLHGSNQFVFILRYIKHNIIHKLNILWELYHPLWEPIQWKLRANLFQFSFRFRKFILNKFFFLSPLNEFLESSTVDRKKSSVSFIWKHMRLLNARRYEEYGILIPFFVLGYSVLQYLKVTSLTFLNLKVDFELIKYLKDSSYVIDLQKLMNPFMPNLWLSYIGDVNSQNETVLSAKFWVDIIALGSIFKSFFEFLQLRKFLVLVCLRKKLIHKVFSFKNVIFYFPQLMCFQKVIVRCGKCSLSTAKEIVSSVGAMLKVTSIKRF
jgi:hypothetical protein